jgi:hypothetical protein
MCAISARKARACAGGWVEAYSSTTGRWSGNSPSARNRPARFIGLGQVDHGRAAVARVAVHMLEQVQRGGAAAVEQLT